MKKIILPSFDKTNTKQRPIIGLATHCHVRPNEQTDMLRELDKTGQQYRLAFVDLALTNNVMGFINQLEQAGHELVIVGDHHFNRKNQSNIQVLRQKLGKGARIFTRAERSSCTGTIRFAEWYKRQIDVVFFDMDIDGICTAWIGAGLFIPRPQDDPRNDIYQIADIMDGGGHGTELTATGSFIADTFNLLAPAFTYDPNGHERVKSEVMQKLTNWVATRCSYEHPDYIDLKTRLEMIKATAPADLNVIMRTLQINDQLAVIDMRSIFEAGRNVDISQLKLQLIRTLQQQNEWPSLLGTIGRGIFQGQPEDAIFIELPRVWQNKLDLRKLVPTGERPPAENYRMVLPLRALPAFRKLWAKTK